MSTITIVLAHEDQVVLVPPAQGSMHWHIGPVLQKEQTPMPIELSLTTEQKCRVFITPMTPAGHPAPLDGPATWSVEGACTVTPIDDTSAWVDAGTDPGDSVLTVSADADLGAGVVNVMDTCTVHVANPMAASLGLQADAPVLK